MTGVKLARNIEQPKRDNYADIADYARCGWEAHLHTVLTEDTVPETCEEPGPQIGTDRPLYVRPKDHSGTHEPDECWHDELTYWV